MPTPAGSKDGFLGTLCAAVSPRGDLYVGSIYDSGWLGGPNIGDIVRLRPTGALPVGIREIRAARNQFQIEFTGPINDQAAKIPANFEITGYTRKWQGAYATPDSGRHQLNIERIEVAADRRSVLLHTASQQLGFVYEIKCGKIGLESQPVLWPDFGAYTWNAVPEER